MLFNSIDFIVFLLIVFTLFWVIPTKLGMVKNLLLLVSSYIFYGWWDWRFCILIVFSSLVDFTVGLLLKQSEEERKRKFFLFISLAINLGLLFTYKYFDFFIAEANTLLGKIGMETSMSSLGLILPVGISFYTFQSLSYSIDVYRKKIEPSRNIIQFLTYVSFFPQLVAGPIERAKSLLPQFETHSKFNYSLAVSGIYQMIWGFFKKIVIADNCAILANEIFNQSSYGQTDGLVLVLGALLFAFQIYGDFSGYSDIAIGTAKLFGIKLMKNFDFPYFARDIAEFWRKWHVSLSTWFKDYVYFPLGGSRGGKLFTLRNVFAIFLVSGFWHGANWTYIVWGLFHASLYIPLYIFNLNRVNTGLVSEGALFPKIKDLLLIILNFLLVCLAWIFFRAATISKAWDYILSMFANLAQTGSDFIFDNSLTLKIILVMVIFLLVTEWINRSKEHGMAYDKSWKKKVSSYLALALIFFYGKFDYQEFIYFQF